MRDYELVLVVSPEAGDEGSPRPSTAYRFIQERGGEIKEVDQWGRRRLAYPIGRYSEGFYAVTHFSLEPDRSARSRATLTSRKTSCGTSSSDRHSGAKARKEKQMAGLNKVMIIGNLGADPEMRYTADGTALTNFRVAATRTYSGPRRRAQGRDRVVLRRHLAQAGRAMQPVPPEGT